jgi:FtsZ-interacting cell division protein ZipA
MGIIRKALFITTLGLSDLVLEDDSKRTATAVQKKRAQKRPKAKASAKRPKRAVARAKSQPEAKTRPKRTKPKGARKPPAARAKPRAAVRSKTASAHQPRPHAAPAAAQPKAQTPAQPKAQTPAQPRAHAPASGTIIALERIAKLHAQGALSDHEFAAAKARILGTAPGATAPAPGEAPTTFPAIQANVAAARRLGERGDPDRDFSRTALGGVGGERGI